MFLASCLSSGVKVSSPEICARFVAIKMRQSGTGVPPVFSLAELRGEKRVGLILLALTILAAGNFARAAVGQETMDRVKSSGRIVSGVNVRAGLADLPTGTTWEGLSVDLAKALAAAVLGDPGKVSFVVADRKSGPEKLSVGEIDLYLPVEPMALSKLASLGLAASQAFFFNVQKIMVTKESGITTVAQLRNKSIAVQPGYVNEQNFETANEEQLRSYFRRAGWQLLIFPFQEWDEMESAFVAGRVNALSAEETELARLRAGNREEVGDAVILPEVIGMQPVSAVVQARDLNWLKLVNATISLLIDAESLGITSDNLERMKAVNDPEIQYVLGVTPGIGIVAGLDDGWGERVIKSVGNYGQMFRRDLGADSPLAIPRGFNELWSRGGLLYSQALR
jgi:general L-amino acid transport system substrate-binding protein